MARKASTTVEAATTVEATTVETTQEMREAVAQGLKGQDACKLAWLASGQDKKVANKQLLFTIREVKPSFMTGEKGTQEKAVYDSFRKNFDNWSKEGNTATKVEKSLEDLMKIINGMVEKHEGLDKLIVAKYCPK